jgi:hypothetical protein
MVVIFFALSSCMAIPLVLFRDWWPAIMMWGLAGLGSAIPWFVYLERDGDILLSHNFGSKRHLDIRKVANAYRGAGVGPYSEIWLSPEKGEAGDTIKLAVGTYGYKGIKQILDDVKSSSPQVRLDHYTAEFLQKLPRLRPVLWTTWRVGGTTAWSPALP